MWPVLVQMWPVLVQMCTVSVSMHALAAFLTIPSVLCLQSLSAPTFNYTANQADINERMRSILVDWLIDVHLKYATAYNTTQHSATRCRGVNVLQHSACGRRSPPGTIDHCTQCGRPYRVALAEYPRVLTSIQHPRASGAWLKPPGAARSRRITSLPTWHLAHTHTHTHILA